MTFQNYYDFIQSVLKKEVDVNSKYEEENALYWLINDFDDQFTDTNECKKIVKKLIDMNININTKDEYKTTPLIYAVIKHHDAVFNIYNYYNKIYLKNEKKKQKIIIKLLLKSGASVNEIDMDGLSALHIASSAKVTQLLIDNDADINIKNNNGQTPLLFNLDRNCSDKLDLIELLISNPSDLFIKDNDDESPFSYAKKKSLYKVIYLFYKHILFDLWELD